MRWGPNQLTERRARELGVDLRHWPSEPPSPGWEDEAACRGVPSAVADTLTGQLSQAAATELVGRWCARCPVIQQCYATGRATHGFGVWGGIVLREGRVATWRTATERARRPATEDISTEIITPPAEIITPPTEIISTTTKRGRGQRVQPRRLTRSRRRKDRLTPGPEGGSQSPQRHDGRVGRAVSTAVG